MTSRLNISKNGKKVVARKGSTIVRGIRDTYNPNYGGGGDIAPYVLPWAPPTLTAPTTIKVTNDTTGVYMDPTKDYIVLLPGARGNDLQTTPHQSKNPASSALTISGGRNVTMIGGAIRRDIDNAAGQYVTSSNKFRAVRNRALYLGDWTGTMFVEGVYFGGQHLYETFNVSTTSATAKLYVQNCIVDTLVLKTPDTYGSSNHDGGDSGMQNWDGPAGGMYVSHYTIRGTTYQGFFMQPAQFGSKVPAENIIQNVDIVWNDPDVFNANRYLPWPYYTSRFGTGVQMFCFSKEKNRQGPTFINNVYLDIPSSGTYSDPTVAVAPHKSDTTNADGENPKPSYNATTKMLTWPGLSAWVTGEGIHIGKRPGGGIVKASYTGIGYISPGYANQSSVTAPTAAPVLSVSPGVQKNDVSWTGVSGAISYKLYRSTTATVTTASTSLGSITSQQYTDSGLSAGTTYYYAVLASNAAGDGPLSNIASGVPTAPATTAGILFSDDFNRADGGIGGGWNDPAGVYRVISNQGGCSTSGLSTTTVENKFLIWPTPAPDTGGYSLAIDVNSASTNTTALHPRAYIGMNDELAPTEWYIATYSDSTTVASRKWVLQKGTFSAGTTTTVEVASDTTYVALGQTRPYTLEVRQTGSLIEVRVGANLVIAYTDPAPLTGRYVGIVTRQGGASGGITNTVKQRFDNAIAKTY